MEKAINNATSIKSIHLEHRRAVRRARQERQNTTDDSGASTLSLLSTLDAARDAALLRLQLQQQKDQDEDLMQQAQEIHPQIYLGPFSVARDATKLARLGITHVVCLSAEGPTLLPTLPNNDDSSGEKTTTKTNVSCLNHPLVEVECTLENGAQQLVAVLPSCWRYVREALGSSCRGPQNKNKDGKYDVSDACGDTNYSVTEDDGNRQNNEHESDATSTRVLIHCLHGKTRSAAIAACIVAELSGHGDFKRAYEHIRGCREVFVPREWHEELQNGVSQLRLL